MAGKIDLAVGATSITKARQESFLFSLPYLVSSGQYIAKNDSAINAIEDIRNKRIGVDKGPFTSEI